MPVPQTAEDLLALVRKSGVVERDLLESFLHSSPAQFSGPEPLATALYRDGLLTRLQTSYLLRGKWRNWVLADKYRILEYLGSGGMGQVYLCEHLRMKRLVAVKIMPPEKSDDQILMRRFVREARAAAALNHPNIVRAYDLDTYAKLHFIVMEFVDGTSLDQIVARSGPLSIPRACEYVRQAALGLQHAFEHNLVHRDIKPANLLLDRNGVVKVHDLGLARCHFDPQNITAQLGGKNLIGTADYLAPEQAVNSHTVDIRADIYSLGATFYFLLTGQSPFPEGTIAQKLVCHQSQPPDSVRRRRPDVPAGIDAIILKMLAKQPDERYSQPIEVAKALEPWIRESIPPPSDKDLPRFCPAVRRIESQMTPWPGSLRSPRPTGEAAHAREAKRPIRIRWPAVPRLLAEHGRALGIALVVVLAALVAVVLYGMRRPPAPQSHSPRPDARRDRPVMVRSAFDQTLPRARGPFSAAVRAAPRA